MNLTDAQQLLEWMRANRVASATVTASSVALVLDPAPPPEDDSEPEPRRARERPTSPENDPMTFGGTIPDFSGGDG